MTTSKKTAPAKKAAPAKAPRRDYKIGTRVKITVTSGAELKGFVTATPEIPTGIKMTPTGPFIAVNVGTKQVPDVREMRPAKVRAY